MDEGKVLIVDNDSSAIQTLKTSLELENYKITVTGDEVTALDSIKKELPDIIYLDETLPKVSGLQVLKKFQSKSETKFIPIIFMTSDKEGNDVVKSLEAGAVDVVIKPVNVLEAVARGKLRIKDAKLRRNFTPMEFFFGEAQEKEGGRRTGVFKFYHNQTQQQVGEVYIEEGKVVYCTYGNAIKEDAFMSICSQRNLSFMFQDLPGAPRKTILASITGLIMEAAKLMDEIADNETGKTVYRVMIVDRDRIPRIVASRLLNQDGFATNVLGVDDVSLVIFEKIKPHCLVVDHLDAEEVLTRLWPDGHLITDIPVILYTTREAKEKIERIKSHAIQGLVEKGKSQTMLASEVRNVLGITV